MSRCRLSLAVCLVVTSLSSDAFAQDPKPGTATGAEIAEQIRQLAPEVAPEKRIAALRWINKHSRETAVAVAAPAALRCLRGEPNAEVRARAVETVALLAHAKGESCPLAVVEAMLDADNHVSETANATACLFKTFAPGAIEALLKCAKSANADLRGGCLLHLARAGGKEKAVRDAIRSARDDPGFSVRHNAWCALFQATDDLPEFLGYLVKLQEDPDAVFGRVDTTTETGKRELVTKNLASLGAAMLMVEWSDTRAADLAPALLNLLDSPSPAMRRGATRLIGACAVKVELAKSALSEPAPDKPPEPSNAMAHFERLKAADRLRSLAEKDPDLTVRAAAKTALERLDRVTKNESNKRR